jgi:hypothetical protein
VALATGLVEKMKWQWGDKERYIQGILSRDFESYTVILYPGRLKIGIPGIPQFSEAQKSPI